MARDLQLENGFTFETKVFCESGSLDEVVFDLVAAEKVDLIVMGTRGASTLLDKLIGTNTLSIMQEAPCPVLAIPANATFTGFRHLAYASDFEKEETGYLQQLLPLAAAFTSEIEVVHVRSDDQLNLMPDRQVISEIESVFQHQAYGLREWNAPSAAQGLTSFMQQNEVDVLAIGMQKRGFLDSLFHHSLSSQLAFESKFPVLALPPISLTASRKKGVTKTSSKDLVANR